MVKRLVMNLFKNIIRKIVQEEVKKELNALKTKPLLLNDIKLNHISSPDKLSVWDAMLLDCVSISFCVTYIDDYGLDDFTSEHCDSLPSLLKYLKNFKPEFNKFCAVSLHVRVKNSRRPVIEQLIKGEVKTYEISEINKIINPLINWIKSQEEHLI